MNAFKIVSPAPKEDSVSGKIGATASKKNAMRETTLKPFTFSLRARYARAQAFKYLCLAMTILCLFTLLLLFWHISAQGFTHLNWQLISGLPSRFVEKAGIKTAIWGTLWMMTLCAFFSVPLGLAAAIYLEEFAKKSKLKELIEINIANLAGVPSIIYGILGLALFVQMMGLGRSILAGSLTMSLMLLPLIIITSREAIRAVPATIRQAAFALGATDIQVVRDHVLPNAIPGIMTGVILALSRAIGETAPLIVMGALTYVAFVPMSPMDEFTVLPIQIFNWTSRPQSGFHELAASAIICLLLVLFLMNGIAVWIRHYHSRKKAGLS